MIYDGLIERLNNFIGFKEAGQKRLSLMIRHDIPEILYHETNEHTIKDATNKGLYSLPYFDLSYGMFVFLSPSKQVAQKYSKEHSETRVLKIDTSKLDKAKFYQVGSMILYKAFIPASAIEVI